MAIAFGVGAYLLGGVKLETGDQLVSIGHVNLTMDSPQQMQRLHAGELGPEIGFARYEGHTSMCFDRPASGIDTEHLTAARSRFEQSEKQSNGGGLARTIGAQTPEDFTVNHIEIEIFEGGDIAESLGQMACRDWTGAHDPHPFPAGI